MVKNVVNFLRGYPLPSPERILVRAPLVELHSLIVGIRCETGFKLQRLINLFERVAKAAANVQYQPTVIAGFCVFWVDLNGAVERRKGMLELTFLPLN